ncbi:MAG: peptide ABC transporter substrate-binding protein [Anaerolineae bacterium]|nr:peptide ABC transporter substrate-binding protein [Phycisphaerae bacterium]
MKKTTQLVGILALLICGGFASLASAQSNKPEISYIDRGDIGTLDPNRMSWAQDIRVGQALFEGLYSTDPVTFKPVLATADSAQVSDDKRVWTFHVRDNAKWSNGDKVTTADFVFAWRRMLEEPGGDYTYLLDKYIVGAKKYEEDFAAYFENKAAGKSATKPDFKTVGIEAIDTSTLRVTLINPCTYFPDLLAFECYFPTNERSMAPFREEDAKTGRVTYNGAWATPPNLVTNGAYMLTSWQLRRGMKLSPNPHYWDIANVKNGGVNVVVAEEPLTQLRKFDAREVDILAEMVGELAANMKAQGRKDIHIDPSFGTYFYTFLCSEKLPDGTPNPFHDVRVRQAFATAIEKEPIVKNITKAGEPVTDVYVPTGIFPGYKTPVGHKFDLKKARALMKEAGFPAGKNFPQIKLTFNTEGGEHKAIAEYVANQWQKNLNVKIDLEGVEIKQFQQRLHNKEYAVGRASWYGDYMDISTFTDKYLTGGGNNDSAWSNKEYDRLCAEADKEPDVAKRQDLLFQAEQILLNEVPIIPMYNYVNKLAYRDEIKGLNPNPRNQMILKNISIEKK